LFLKKKNNIVLYNIVFRDGHAYYIIYKTLNTNAVEKIDIDT